ncbi:MAG: glycosyltransferase family 4 protein [Muribaculaceae bacterium]|nr:glycosyltransferase family 4 protein [Muribaculaceae bacterium]
MRIAYTCQDISVHGGLERIIADKASAMAARGHDVCLIVNCPPGSTCAYALHPRVGVFDISLPGPSGLLSTLRFKWRQNMRILKALRRFRPDITVAVPTWLTLGMFMAPGRLVLESHDYRPLTFVSEKSSRYKRFKAAVAELLASAVVTLTLEDKALWPAAGRVELIPNFSNISHPAQSTGRREGDAVAMVRLAPQKQIDLLIDAWAEVTRRHPHATLDIYGDGPQREWLQQRIEALALDGCVRLRGCTSDATAEYASHGFLVLSSMHEGFGLVLIEAMACGCPCVAVDCPAGPREIIDHGRDGLLVPYRGLTREQQMRNLADAICSMLDNPERTAEMGRRARTSVARFDKDAIMSRWEKLFKDLCRK